jgi:NAD(P)-dependent dehydrogenase (short-subunit alcohol dehydrogenase family)
MPGKLHDKVALVTGGSFGMGLATAARFVEEGALVYVTGCRQEPLDAGERCEAADRPVGVGVEEFEEVTA